MDQDGYIVNQDGKYVYGFGEQHTKGTEYPAFEGGWTKIPVTDGAKPTRNIKPIKIPTDAQTMSIGNDGLVTFVDSEGTLRVAGQLVLAKFPNAGGLQKAGANYYQPTANSGNAFWALGTENGMGTVQSGSLEMSNVDLGEEFTEMIVAQRGFQANTRIITTSDEILQELVNLKR